MSVMGDGLDLPGTVKEKDPHQLICDALARNARSWRSSR
jgi:hypothetical protein